MIMFDAINFKKAEGVLLRYLSEAFTKSSHKPFRKHCLLNRSSRTRLFLELMIRQTRIRAFWKNGSG